MDLLFVTAGIVYILGVAGTIVFVAQVNGMLPKPESTKKLFGPGDWGVYHGVAPRVPKSMKTIESKVSIQETHRTAGSQSYSRGG